MPRTPTPPRYCLHKASGQARVLINGKHHYLGKHGSKASKERYARLLMERASAPQLPAATVSTGDRRPDLLVCELLLQFIEHAERYYVHQDGQRATPTGEIANIRDAMRPVRALYDTAQACDFGPRALKAVRQYMIDTEGLSRKVVNNRVNRIRRIFKWAVSEELLPSSVYEALRTVDGLRYGRTHARETKPIQPVPDETVEATLAFLPPIVADMVRLQRLTGMRPGDVVQIRPCDIDRSGSLWVYAPPQHKTAYLGHRRQIPLGPKARAIVEPYMSSRAPHVPLFSPAEAQAWRVTQKAEQPSKRLTPVYPSERRRVEAAKRTRRKRKPQKAPGSGYTTSTYYRAIQYAQEQALREGTAIAHWHPNQLRHSKATEVRREFGLEAAQVVLGHRQADVTQVYAARDLQLAVQVAKTTG